MARTVTTDRCGREPRHDTSAGGPRRTAPRARVLLPPSDGNASLLPLPLPESQWPPDAVHPCPESSCPGAAMFVPRVTAQVLVVTAVLALTFVG